MNLFSNRESNKPSRLLENTVNAVVATSLAVISLSSTFEHENDKRYLKNFIEENANDSELEQELSEIADRLSGEEDTQVSCGGIDRFVATEVAEDRNRVGIFFDETQSGAGNDLIVIQNSLCDAITDRDTHSFTDIEQAAFTFSHEIGHQKGYGDELDADCYAASVYGLIVKEFISSEIIYTPRPNEILSAPHRFNDYSKC